MRTYNADTELTCQGNYEFHKFEATHGGLIRKYGHDPLTIDKRHEEA